MKYFASMDPASGKDKSEYLFCTIVDGRLQVIGVGDTLKKLKQDIRRSKFIAEQVRQMESEISEEYRYRAEDCLAAKDRIGYDFWLELWLRQPGHRYDD